MTFLARLVPSRFKLWLLPKQAYTILLRNAQIHDPDNSTALTCQRALLCLNYDWALLRQTVLPWEGGLYGVAFHYMYVGRQLRRVLQLLAKPDPELEKTCNYLENILYGRSTKPPVKQTKKWEDVDPELSDDSESE